MIIEVSIEKCGDTEYGFCFGKSWHVEYKRVGRAVKWNVVGKCPSIRLAKKAIKDWL
ncbi:hypothetical protein VPSG_00045 [Vibrio phage pYD38-B]|uniref:hypothetical protein n=1 Tax=Vibrio phage pYD38-B TaxID=929835 RepID=UPI0003425A53|nr:hypothetical protein VPSG_00045 [Vibrio phage pYD38-B]AGN34364.1 hypothetical protein VPSG_00045 [Vibrio phage pYD38-B]